MNLHKLSGSLKPTVTWNYFRLHLTFFTLHPLVWSGIFYAVNGEFPIPYVDSLFLCFSAQTVTGLSTVNLSTLTAFQQVILLWLMITGSYTTTSWVMVMVRRRYFIQKCAHFVKEEKQRKITVDGGPSTGAISRIHRTLKRKATVWFGSNPSNGELEPVPRSDPEAQSRHSDAPADFRSELCSSPVDVSDEHEHEHDPEADFRSEICASPVDLENSNGSPPGHFLTVSSSNGHGHNDGYLAPSVQNTLVGVSLQRTTSPSSMSIGSTGARGVRSVDFAVPTSPSSPRRRPTRNPTRSGTMLTTRSSRSANGGPGLSEAHETGLGGFAGPVTLTTAVFERMAPGAFRRLKRKLTVLPYGELKPIQEVQVPEKAKAKAKSTPNPTRRDSRESSEKDWSDLEAAKEKVVSYVRTAIQVGRNSFFDTEALSDEELEQVGGVEYKAIDLLAWLVPTYMLGTVFCTFVIFTAYLLNVHTYDGVFQGQYRLVPVPWFSAFQALSAYVGGGLSLVDTGMVPFIGAYTLVISLGMLICAGNMLMPVFLRLVVWLLFKMMPRDSDLKAPLQFLLDHPRRCFLYLFPSHQTWFLVATFFFLTAVEWGGFLLFDYGLEVIDSIPRGPRVLAGLFQSLGVRASGFSIVSLGSLAPAVKLVYLLMMYISAYPIAMSVRSTNVYEERSLGVFQPDEPDEETQEPQGEIFSRYLGWHVRKQLAFDLWWLAAGVLVICIIERGNIMDPSNDTWFNIFTVIFEIVSAYATIGLSLGIPTENYAFSGALATGSKLIIIAVMLRGRHRDLPVAVDRAILLPQEFNRSRINPKGQHILLETEVTIFPTEPRESEKTV